MGKQPLSDYCEVYSHAIELIGRRWTGAILRAMLAGHTRFNDIARTVPGLSDRLLSERLKELESEGILERCVTPSTPVSISYVLTDAGRGLAPIVQAIADWTATWSRSEARSA